MEMESFELREAEEFWEPPCKPVAEVERGRVGGGYGLCKLLGELEKATCGLVILEMAQGRREGDVVVNGVLAPLVGEVQVEAL